MQGLYALDFDIHTGPDTLVFTFVVVIHNQESFSSSQFCMALRQANSHQNLTGPCSHAVIAAYAYQQPFSCA